MDKNDKKHNDKSNMKKKADKNNTKLKSAQVPGAPVVTTSSAKIKVKKTY